MQLDLGRKLQEIAGVRAGHVGDTANLALAPEQAVVIELRNAIEVNGVDGDHTAFSQTGERSHHHISAGREGDGAIQFGRWLVSFGAYPFGSQRLGQAAMRGSSRGDIDVALPRVKDLDRKMR